jgi:hypothetical protein
VKCTFNCSYQLDNTLTADLKKMDCSIKNSLSGITNIENDTEVIFVHALNIKYSLVCVKPFPKKAGYFNFSSQLFSEIRKCIVGCIFNSVGHIITGEILCIN